LIAKLAHRYLAHGKKVLLAAGDTFRAAATEQRQKSLIASAFL
jgi:fused signal recognition particle receptor